MMLFWYVSKKGFFPERLPANLVPRIPVDLGSAGDDFPVHLPLRTLQSGHRVEGVQVQAGVGRQNSVICYYIKNWKIIRSNKCVVLWKNMWKRFFLQLRMKYNAYNTIRHVRSKLTKKLERIRYLKSFLFI